MEKIKTFSTQLKIFMYMKNLRRLKTQ